MSVAVWLPDLCPDHGCVAGVLPDGAPRCPGCRLRLVVEQLAEARLARFGPVATFDHKMRQAGDRTLLDDLDESA